MVLSWRKTNFAEFCSDSLPLKCKFILRILLINAIYVSFCFASVNFAYKKTGKTISWEHFLNISYTFSTNKKLIFCTILNINKKNEGKRFEAPVRPSHKKSLWYCSLKIFFLWIDICFSLFFFIVLFFEILEPKLRSKLWFSHFLNFEIGYRSFGSLWSAAIQPTPRH